MQDTILRTGLLAELNIWEMLNGIENGRGARVSLRTHFTYTQAHIHMPRSSESSPHFRLTT
jgi:hypothetical protein